MRDGTEGEVETTDGVDDDDELEIVEGKVGTFGRTTEERFVARALNRSSQVTCCSGL
jgi:hypothetical protein